MWAGALATTIAHTVPATVATAIAGPLAGIVAHAIAIFVNRVRPGALVLAGALAGIVTHTIAILVNIFACALTLTRPLALLGKGGGCDGKPCYQRKDDQQCAAK
jgi:hypothetical protein